MTKHFVYINHLYHLYHSVPSPSPVPVIYWPSASLLRGAPDNYLMSPPLLSSPIIWALISYQRAVPFQPPVISPPPPPSLPPSQTGYHHVLTHNFANIKTQTSNIWSPYKTKIVILYLVQYPVDFSLLYKAWHTVTLLFCFPRFLSVDKIGMKSLFSRSIFQQTTEFQN